MKVGIVCPYSLDTPGGVQSHVRDLAEALLGLGHQVSVLAPGEGPDLPPYVVPAGRTVAVHYNGAVARISFGPLAAARARRWLKDGDFDVLHLHEPATPSLSLLALWAAECPVVATFHSMHDRSRALSASAAVLRPSLEKITARIAVSESARGTSVRHLGGEPVIIPNGLYVDRIAGTPARSEWRGTQGTVVFVGRLGEPRKGFPLLAQAFASVAATRPGLRLVVVGGGDLDQARALLPRAVLSQVSFLGPASDADKAAARGSAAGHDAPNTRAESVGRVVAEAMAAGATVLASDLPAFRRLLDGGAHGMLFRNGDQHDLASRLAGLLEDPDGRARLAASARGAVRRYDWAGVTARIVQVYETVVDGRS